MTSKEWLVAHDIFPDKNLIKALDKLREETIREYEHKRWMDCYRGVRQ